MEHWISQYNVWTQNLENQCPRLKIMPFEGAMTVNPYDFWNQLGDDNQLFNVEAFLAKSEGKAVRDAWKEAPQREMYERQRRGFLEQSQERLLDSYRYLLCDRLDDLFPLNH